MGAQQHGRAKTTFKGIFFFPRTFPKSVTWGINCRPLSRFKNGSSNTSAMQASVSSPFPVYWGRWRPRAASCLWGGHMMEEAALMPCGWLSSWTLGGRSHHASWVGERLWGPIVLKSRLSRRWEHFWSSAPWACGSGSIRPQIFFSPERNFFFLAVKWGGGAGVEAGDERSPDHESNQRFQPVKTQVCNCVLFNKRKNSNSMNNVSKDQ